MTIIVLEGLSNLKPISTSITLIRLDDKTTRKRMQQIKKRDEELEQRGMEKDDQEDLKGE